MTTILIGIACVIAGGLGVFIAVMWAFRNVGPWK